MIFLFQGDRSRGRNARSCMALAACVERFKTDKKVLIMSLKNNMPGNNIEDFLEEDTTTDSSGKNISYVTDAAYRDDGIDAVIRRAESGILKKDQFDNCVTQLLNVDHGLDMLRTSKESTFEASLLRKWSAIEKVIKIADSLYDYVFIYAGVENEDFIDKLNQLATKIVFVARQGRKVTEPKANDKVHAKKAILIADYEVESSWNIKHMKRMYDTNNVYTFPHNVKFGDIKEHGKIVKFAATNVNLTQSDYNFELMKEVRNLIGFLDGQEKETEHRMVQDLDYQPLEKPKRTVQLDEHPTDIHTEETETKGSLFKKKEHFFTNFFGRGKKQNINELPAPTEQQVEEPVEDFEQENEPVHEHMSNMPELSHEFEHIIDDDDEAQVEEPVLTDDFTSHNEEPDEAKDIEDIDIDESFLHSIPDEEDDATEDQSDDTYDSDDDSIDNVSGSFLDSIDIETQDDDFTDDDDISDNNDDYTEVDGIEIPDIADGSEDDFMDDESETKPEDTDSQDIQEPADDSGLDIDTDWMSELVVDDIPDEPEEPQEFTEDLMFAIGTDPL